MTNNYIRATVFGEPDETGRIPTRETEVFFFDDHQQSRENALACAHDWLLTRTDSMGNALSVFRPHPKIKEWSL
jgi:hypothetical protein